jgi:3-(3-hydroxy-phenyl)propionate hydroxylase
MPVTGDRYRWERRLAPGESVAQAMTPDRLAALLAPVDPAAVEIVRAVEYIFRAQIADRWRAGRVFLAGDAAHLSPPFVGQGMGLGLRDVHQLAWKLAAVLAGEAGDDLLDSYQAEREPHARALIRIAQLLGRLMTRGGRAGDVLRHAVLAVARRIPAVARLATDSRTPALAAGPQVERRGRAGRRLVGTLVPQPEVVVDGRRWRFDDALDRVLDGAAGAELALVGAGLLTLSAADRPALRVQEGDGVLAKWLTDASAVSVRIRPDRIVRAAVPRHRGLRGLRAAGGPTGWSGIAGAWRRGRPAGREAKPRGTGG